MVSSNESRAGIASVRTRAAWGAPASGCERTGGGEVRVPAVGVWALALAGSQGLGTEKAEHCTQIELVLAWAWPSRSYITIN